MIEGGLTNGTGAPESNATRTFSGFLSFDDLSAILGHEIGNPLNNIAAAVQVLEQYLHEKEGRVDEPISELLRLLKEEINRLTLLLDNLRSLKLFGLDLQPRSLASLVNDSLALESIKAARRRIHFESDVPLDFPVILADGAKLKQVILNLCENAIEAMPAGGTLAVRAYTDHDEMCLDIRDSGDGIPEGVQVFAPFVTTKARGRALDFSSRSGSCRLMAARLVTQAEKEREQLFILLFRSAVTKSSPRIDNAMYQQSLLDVYSTG